MPGGSCFAVSANPPRFEISRVIAVDSESGKERWSTLGENVSVLSGLAIITHGSHLEAARCDVGQVALERSVGRTDAA